MSATGGSHSASGDGHTASGNGQSVNADSHEVDTDDESTWWYLRLYVAGQSAKSMRAFANLKDMCEKHLAGHYEIEVIDLIENPVLAGGDDILAVPTLVRRLPPPLRKVIGDLSDPAACWSASGSGRSLATMTSPHDATLERFEDQLAALDESDYELTLFVSGASDLAARAIANARRLCDVHLHGRCHLSVVDVHENPAAVLSSRLLATPTLRQERAAAGAEGRWRPVRHRQGAPGAGPPARSAHADRTRLGISWPDTVRRCEPTPRPTSASRPCRVGPHDRRDRQCRQRNRRSDPTPDPTH